MVDTVELNESPYSVVTRKGFFGKVYDIEFQGDILLVDVGNYKFATKLVGLLRGAYYMGRMRENLLKEYQTNE